MLVTGAAGFIGSRLAKAAEQLGEVVAVSRRANEGNGAAVDLTNPAQTSDLFNRQRPDVVLHAAARIPVSGSEDIHTFFSDNVAATVNLYHAAHSAGVKRIVLSSSMSVYGPPRSLPVSEQHPAVPDLPYALSKIQAELVGEHFAGIGLETTVLRYSGVFGAGQRSGAVPAFIARSLQNSPIIINAGGRPSSDFVWVDDVVQANLLAVQYSPNRKFEVLNVGSGTELSILQLAETIRDLCGSQSVITLTETPSPRNFRFSYDIARAREILGFSPTPMETALRRCIRQKQEGKF